MKKLFILPVSLLFIFLIVNSAMATGIGIYGTVGGSKNFSPDTFAINGGGGFIFDTNISKNAFNYRLNLGLEAWNDRMDIDGGTASYTAFMFRTVHTFGFTMSQTKSYRFWLGPQFHVGVGFKDGFHGVNAGLGFAIGTNINISEKAAFLVDGAIRGGYLMRGAGGSYAHGGNVSFHLNLGVVYKMGE